MLYLKLQDNLKIKKKWERFFNVININSLDEENIKILWLYHMSLEGYTLKLGHERYFLNA